MTADPPGPEGLRVEYADGSTSGPLPILFLGVGADGMNLWEVVLPDDRAFVAVRADRVPARTAIHVPLPDVDDAP